MPKIYLVGKDVKALVVKKMLESLEERKFEVCHYKAFILGLWDQPGIMVFFPLGYKTNDIKWAMLGFRAKIQDRKIRSYMVCSPSKWKKLEFAAQESFDGAVHVKGLEVLVQEIGELVGHRF
jgi:hypothetical protein